jgi:hypothetical protein
MRIILKDLPKISLNKWYAGTHWTKRKEIKDNYKLIIKNQFKEVLSKDKHYHVSYYLCFKTRPLDASNCAAMVKLIEDVIFEDDNFKIVESITIQSVHGNTDFVEIEIIEP